MSSQQPVRMRQLPTRRPLSLQDVSTLLPFRDLVRSNDGVQGRVPPNMVIAVSKVRYEIDLTQVSPAIDPDERIRSVTLEDAAELASLMLDAYRHTIDYDDEDLEDAIAEIDSFLANAPLLEMSRVVVDDGEIVSGTLVSETEEGPLVAYVMTRASHKSKGLGVLVTGHALKTLADAGHKKVVFYITEGNEPSERLFRSLGAEAR